VLFPRGDLARDTLATALCDRAAVVDDPIVYRTSASEPGASKLAEMIAENKVNAVAFASPSAVRFAMQASANLASVRCFSIGPTTSDELRMHGLAVAAQASPHDANGLAAAIVAHARGQSA
jgi:uroporphyrinogen III methyltransferase/synthase